MRCARRTPKKVYGLPSPSPLQRESRCAARPSSVVQVQLGQMLHDTESLRLSLLAGESLARLVASLLDAAAVITPSPAEQSLTLYPLE